jgi:hypothetical protein
MGCVILIHELFRDSFGAIHHDDIGGLRMSIQLCLAPLSFVVRAFSMCEIKLKASFLVH